VSGSDAHGTPIVVAAEKDGQSPEEVAFRHHEEYVKLLKRWEIDLDNYTITHNPLHIKFCQEFYRKISKNGYIFQSRTEQSYCVKCERFLPDRLVQGVCPRCGWPEARGDQCTNPDCEQLLAPTDLMNPRCAVCGAPPILKETTHWYFDLPKLSKQIKKFLEDCPILSESARSFAKSIVKEGLKPRPITRDLEWGIPADPIFEGAEGKVLYVWAENILGYLSATKEWFEQCGKPREWKKLWQTKNTKTVFCIGKDNTIFHAIIFPALLIAAQDHYVLPYAVAVTEFITFRGQPFSKSKGIGVGAEEALTVAPADYWRYFLVVERPETKDANFTWESFVLRVNKDLNDVLGNFVHRTLTFIYKEFCGKVPERAVLNDEDKELLRLIESAARKQAEHIEKLELKDSLKTVLSLARAGNTYLSSRKPWELVKKDRGSTARTLNVAVQVVNALGVLIYPYLPQASRRIRKTLNLPEEVNQNEYESLGDTPIRAGHPISEPKVLFRKLNIDELDRAVGR
jgi:methionyl-tRNA synthetase